MIVCPVCATAPCAPIIGTPYAECPNCKLWAQYPLPPKMLHHEHEAPGDAMSQHERSVNAQLADYLFNTVMQRKPGLFLDVGSKFPWLAKCMSDHLCCAHAMEAHPDGKRYAEELGVYPIAADFETCGVREVGEPFKLITFIHVWEHLYHPVESLRKLRTLIADDGKVFFRLPMHDVSGREQHLSEDHFKIHGFFYSLRSLLQLLLVAKNCFVMESCVPIVGAGQSDVILRPI